MQVVESSSLVSILFREPFSHPYISFFYLLVNVFSVISISVVVIASVYSEKTRLKNLMKIIIIIMNKLQETTVFHGHQKLTSAMKLRLRVVIVDLKFDAQYG